MLSRSPTYFNQVYLLDMSVVKQHKISLNWDIGQIDTIWIRQGIQPQIVVCVLKCYYSFSWTIKQSKKLSPIVSKFSLVTPRRCLYTIVKRFLGEGIRIRIRAKDSKKSVALRTEETTSRYICFYNKKTFRPKFGAVFSNNSIRRILRKTRFRNNQNVIDWRKPDNLISFKSKTVAIPLKNI